MNIFYVRHLKRSSKDESYETNANTYLHIPTAPTHKRRFKKRTGDNNSKDMNLHDLTLGSLQFLYFFFLIDL